MKEVKIGIMITFGLVLLAGLIIYSGGGYFYQKGYTINVYFDYVGGLDKGAPVRLAGMEVGEVRDLRIKGKKVVVIIWLKESSVVCKDSRITINSLGIVGEKYVEITMGQNGKHLKNGDSVIGVTPVNIEEIFNRTESIVNKSEKLVAVLDKMLGEQETWLEIDKIIKNVSTFTTTINDLLDKNKDGLNQSITNMTRLTANFNNLIAENRNNVKITTDNFKDAAIQIKDTSNQLKKTFEQANRTLTNIDKTMTNLDKAALDSKNKMTSTLSNINKTANSIDKAATSLDAIIKRVENGQGGLGKMIVDKEMANNLSEAVANLNTLSKNLREHPWKLLQKEPIAEKKTGFFKK